MNQRESSESCTWFEAVWVRPNGRIMVSAKQIGDDDRVSRDEVTCNAEHSSQISVEPIDKSKTSCR